ncbi:hypothetical protein A0H81_08290 [Grifola frondosa]|uniref:Uncharacterized protein n=1 Tax=Grifola frondosa TaxID=5627 RepID=A0A1C7M608_GRIFR|nr:hypothetical protein A0H81_08290 [Grifola frondosa]
MAKNRKGHSKPSSSSEQAVEISEEEQWRIINDTGILKKVPQATQVEQLAEEEAEEESILANEIFNAVTLIIPMSSLLLLMEMYVSFIRVCYNKDLTTSRDSLVHYQYGREPSYRDLMDRMLPSVPSTLLTSAAG